MTKLTSLARGRRLSANSIRSLPEAKRHEFLNSLTDLEASLLLYDWSVWARPAQTAPKGDWVHWLILAGRGFGKTRTGAEWVRYLVETGQARHIALVAPTAADARATMVEGESGLLAISPPWFRPIYEPSKRQLKWPNGAKATTFSADEPERLRGPQHDAAWMDELCAWRYPDEAFDMLMFGLRLGAMPRTCITTTPKPTPLIKRLVASRDVSVTKGTTYDNLVNLAPTFKKSVVDRYEGTRLGRQELNAEILEDVAGALWSRDMIEKRRLSVDPFKFMTDMDKIIVAVDPPTTSGPSADECGLIVAARRGDGFYVLADRSGRMSPLEWAKAAVTAYTDFQADKVVAEVNQGGDMVVTLLQQVNPNVPVKKLTATRGKIARAEPIAALYEQGKVAHIGCHQALEDQMCSYTGAGSNKSANSAAGARSPDRLDALVWALSELTMTAEAMPSIFII